jgi:hypothetical protein
MFIEKQVQEALGNLVGWRNTTLPNFSLSTENAASESGLYFNDANGLCTLENLYYSIKPESMTDTQFNDYLKAQKEAATIRVLRDIFASEGTFVEKIGGKIDGTSTLPEKPKEAGKYTGFELQVNTEKFLLQLNTATFFAKQDESFKLQLYNTNIKAPVEEWDIDLVAETEKEFKLDFSLNGKSGGRFYLVVSEDELNGDIFCFDGQTNDALGAVDVFRVEYTDIKEPKYISEGKLFVIDYSIYKDWTTFIIDNRQLFSQQVQQAVTISVINSIFTSTRSNILQRLGENIVAQAYEYLNGNETQKSIITTYEKSVATKKAELFKKRRMFKSTLRSGVIRTGW